MKLKTLKTLFLTAFLIDAIQGKTCSGGAADALPDDCTIIKDKPLVFKGDVNEPKMRQKLAKVTKIQAGVEVINTNIIEFNLLPDVMEISNKNGPALLFRENAKLARIHLPKLLRLEGKTNDVSFDNDHFPTVYRDKDAMTDLLLLEAAGSRAHRDREPCSTDFLSITAPAESSGFGWMFYVLIAFNVIIAIILGVQIFFLLMLRSAAKKKDAEGEPKKTRKKL